MLPNILKNWKTSLLGLASVILAVLQMSGKHSFKEAFLDPVTQMAIISAAIGFLAKDKDVTGTAANPRAVNQGEPTPIVAPVVAKP